MVRQVEAGAAIRQLATQKPVEPETTSPRALEMRICRREWHPTPAWRVCSVRWRERRSRSGVERIVDEMGWLGYGLDPYQEMGCYLSFDVNSPQ